LFRENGFIVPKALQNDGSPIDRFKSLLATKPIRVDDLVQDSGASFPICDGDGACQSGLICDLRAGKMYISVSGKLEIVAAKLPQMVTVIHSSERVHMAFTWRNVKAF
jgi:hypothetical protein